MFQREMTFNKDFTLMAIQRVAMFIITVATAVIWRSYWALLAGMLTGVLTECGLSYLMHAHRPRWCRSRWGEIFHFSKWLMLNNLLAFLSNRAPDLVVGRLIGPKAVGLFSVGYELSMLPSTELVAPINRALLPGFSRKREESGGVEKVYLDVLGLVALLVLPAGIGIAATASVVIPFLLGNKWIEVVPIVQYLAVSGAITASFANNWSVYLAIGKPHLTTIILLSTAFLLVASTIYGSISGSVITIAQLYLFSNVFMAIVGVVIILNTINVSFRDYVKVTWRPIVSCLIMYFVVEAFLDLFFDYESLAFASICSISVGFFSYVLAILLIWYFSRRPDGAEVCAINFCLDFIRKKSPDIANILSRAIK